MPRVVHFEIPADRPERASRFYTEVFDWKMEKWGGPTDYWLAMTGSEKEPGIDGAIMDRTGPVKVVSVSIQVPSVDEYSRKITTVGGKIITPKLAIPGVGYLAYCEDTEGNPFSIFQDDKTAR